MQSSVPLLGLPGMWPILAEQHLNLLKRLAACFGEGEVELNCGSEAEGAEDDEGSPTDVEEGRGDEEADCEVEEPVCQELICGMHVSVVGYLLPVAAIPIPFARVSSDHTSAA